MKEARVERESGQCGQGGEGGDEGVLGPTEEAMVLGERQGLPQWRYL